MLPPIVKRELPLCYDLRDYPKPPQRSISHERLNTRYLFRLSLLTYADAHSVIQDFP